MVFLIIRIQLALNKVMFAFWMLPGKHGESERLEEIVIIIILELYIYLIAQRKMQMLWEENKHGIKLVEL